MKLTLSQQELEAAVRNYVTGMINLADGTEIGIDFTAGRGTNGITAEVDISYLAVQSIPATTVSQKTPIDISKDTGGIGPRVLVNEVSVDGLTKAERQAAEMPADKADKPKAAETRKTSGKSLFGAGKGSANDVANVDPEAVPANDSDAGEVEAEEIPAAATGESKTLFN